MGVILDHQHEGTFLQRRNRRRPSPIEAGGGLIPALRRAFPPGDADDERGTFTYFTFQHHASAVQLGQAAHHGQSQPRPFVSAGQGAIDLDEGLEELGLILL